MFFRNGMYKCSSTSACSVGSCGRCPPLTPRERTSRRRGACGEKQGGGGALGGQSSMFENIHVYVPLIQGILE